MYEIADLLRHKSEKPFLNLAHAVTWRFFGQPLQHAACIIHGANNKGSRQTVPMRMLVCAFVVPVHIYQQQPLTTYVNRQQVFIVVILICMYLNKKLKVYTHARIHRGDRGSGPPPPPPGNYKIYGFLAILVWIPLKSQS